MMTLEVDFNSFAPWAEVHLPVGKIRLWKPHDIAGLVLETLDLTDSKCMMGYSSQRWALSVSGPVQKLTSVLWWDEAVGMK
jgi:hypothetical protein